MAAQTIEIRNMRNVKCWTDERATMLPLRSIRDKHPVAEESFAFFVSYRLHSKVLEVGRQHSLRYFGVACSNHGPTGPDGFVRLPMFIKQARRRLEKLVIDCSLLVDLV